VSIVCLTFNHEKYIAQAIEGFLFQETAFPFEIIIHDDASVDRTLEIVMEYQVRYPELITVIAQSENLYSKGKDLTALVFGYARGAFIAYCEGDDYWCVSHKIQRQAEFLLNSPEHGVVFTNSRVLYEQGNRVVPGRDRSALGNVSSEHGKALLLVGNPYTSSTAMFRAEAVKGYEEIARKLHPRMGDLVMWLFIAGRYRVGVLSDVTTTYRVRARSASHLADLADMINFQKSAHRVFSYFNRQFGYLVAKEQLKTRYRRAMIEFCLANGRYKASFRYARFPAEYVSCFSRVLLRRIYIVVTSSFFLSKIDRPPS
jgi:glycosyltransferase involved in cell wall biosynthesis